MVAAIAAKRVNPLAEVSIIDRMKQLGKKLLATGNGRGNFTNIKATPSYYNDSYFVEKVFELVSLFDTLHFFEELGIFAKNDSEGRMYPFSDQASAIHEVLMMEIGRLNINVKLETNVDAIEKKNNHFKITTQNGLIICDKIIITAGGMAYPNLGSNGSGYQLLKSLGHTITKIYPSLVGIKVKENMKQLGGIRIKGLVTLESNGQELGSEDGEIQMRDTGISGIVIMQMSVIIARRKVLGLTEPYKVNIDLMPTLSVEDVSEILINRYITLKHRNLSNFFVGMFHNQLGKEMLYRVGVVDLNAQISTLNKEQLTALSQLIKQLTFEFVDFYSLEDAQVCSGGVVNDEFDPQTLQSNKISNLYAAGEVFNVDGETGGYNLQWAWASGMLAGKSAAK
jgi:predicted Rossmann fold flavoprotein